jgi:hypothetical protein
MLIFYRECELKDYNKNRIGSNQIRNLNYFSVASNIHVAKEVGSKNNFNFDFNQTSFPPF